MAQITLNSTGIASNGTLTIQTNGTVAAVTIDASQRLIVGATSAAEGSPVEIVSNTGGGSIRIRGRASDGSGAVTFGTNATSTEYARVASDSNSALLFGTGSSGAERARIDSSGNFGIGTSTAQSKLTVAGVAPAASSPATYQGTIQINETALSTLQAIGGLEFRGAVFGSGYGSKITGLDAGELLFGNRINSASWTERARIDSSGNFTVGATAGSWGSASGNQVSPSFQQINKYNGVNGDQFIAFSRNSSTIGSITQSGTTAVLYNVTSDQRLKENIQDADSASSLIDSLQVRKFDWKTDQTHQRYGFIAQELVTVAPEAVHQPADTDEMMAVDYSKLVPMLVKEIQSLRQRLAAANL